jgi:hypothetical protein
VNLADVTAVGELIIGAGVLCTSVLSLRNGRAIRAAHATIRDVDAAVNTKQPHEQTISEQVSDLASRLPAQDAAAAKVIGDAQP